MRDFRKCRAKEYHQKFRDVGTSEKKKWKLEIVRYYVTRILNLINENENRTKLASDEHSLSINCHTEWMLAIKSTRVFKFPRIHVLRVVSVCCTVDRQTPPKLFRGVHGNQYCCFYSSSDRILVYNILYCLVVSLPRRRRSPWWFWTTKSRCLWTCSWSSADSRLSRPHFWGKWFPGPCL